MKVLASHNILAFAVTFLIAVGPAGTADLKPAMVMEGYPAFDAPIVRYLLRRAGAQQEGIQRQWLDTKDYGKYSVIFILGMLLHLEG